jgi:hypothetical protein
MFYLFSAAPFKVDQNLVDKLVARFRDLISPSVVPEIVSQLENDGN